MRTRSYLVIALLCCLFAAPVSAHGTFDSADTDWFYTSDLFGLTYDKETRPEYCTTLDKALITYRLRTLTQWFHMTAEQRSSARDLYFKVRGDNPICYEVK